MGVGRFAFTPLLPMMQEDAGLSVTLGGWLAAANYAGYLLGALAAVKLRLSAAAAMRGGLATIGLVTLAMGLTHALEAWIALRFIAGVASAMVLIFVSSWCIERVAALGRPALGGVVFTGVGIGVTMAGLICLLLMTRQVSSSTAWIVLGVISLLTCLAFFNVVKNETKEEAKAQGQASVPDGPRLVLCYGAYGLGYIIPATFIPAMAKAIIPDPAIFGWAWPLFGIAAGASTLATASWAARAPRQLWVWCHVVMAVGVALPAIFGGLWPIMVAALCVGGTFVTITLAGIQEARRVAGAAARPLIAAMTAAFAAGQMIGPIVGVAAGINPSLIAASALLALSALWLAMNKDEA
jgi:predicted MFS family arabinose efflux permease